MLKSPRFTCRGAIPSIFLLVALTGLDLFPAQAQTAQPSSATDSTGRTSVQTFDENGRLVAITDASGKKTYPGQSGLSASKPSHPIKSLALAATTSPAIIHVPADQSTIQAAINAANNGDTVLVADGVYRENIDFKGKAITVTSVNGASKTTIDGGGLNTVVSFDTGEAPDSVLNGFTLTNGSAGFQPPNYGQGGGIRVGNSSPTITNNVIQANKACEGAGISVSFGAPLVRGNVISNNSQAGCSGGTGGGGILVGGASSTGTRIIGNIISNNSMASSGLGGGGISLNAVGSPMIEDNFILGNETGGLGGGGISIVNDSHPQITQNLFFGNVATQGGAIFLSLPSAAQALSFPPGLQLLNNTLAQNSSSMGSAIYDGGYDTNLTIENNLLIGNVGQAAYFCQLYNPATAVAVFSNNDIFSSGTTAISGNCTVAVGTNGNISVDPQFISAAANNFHLQFGSPAIAAGNASDPNLPVTDLDGFPRSQSGAVDIGAYEFSQASVSFTPASLTFPAQPLGTASAPQPVTITNTGSDPLFLATSINDGAGAAAPAFFQTSNCPSRVTPGSSCTIQVSFTPSAISSRSGTLLLVDNAAGNPQSVSLTGTGQAFPATFSPSTLAFGTQVLTRISAAKTVTLTNTATTPVSLAFAGSITAGFFVSSKTCGSTLAPLASCAFSVKFSPVAIGPTSGFLSINNTPTGFVGLTGTGTAMGLSPSALIFPAAAVGTVSAPQTVTVTNRSAATVNFSAISIYSTHTGAFTITSQTCGTTLAPNSTCTVTVTFKATAVGSESAALQFFDDGGSSPQFVNMTGVGTSVASASPASK